jgi:16S rRNA (uracil1498-N3)-methyltransferase
MNILLFFPRDAVTRSGNGDSTPHFHIPLSDPRAQHVLKILRLTPGDSVKAGIVDGPRGCAILETFADPNSGNPGQPGNTKNRGNLLFRFIPDLKEGLCADPGLFPLELVVGQVRPICAKRILREAAMLGVSAISFVGTDLGEKSYREAKLWGNGEAERYLVDGVVQAGVTAMPQLRLFSGLEDYLKELNKRESGEKPLCSVVLDTIREGRTLAEIAGRYPAAIAVGSERGWSNRERLLLEKNGWISATLGDRILRTETACTVAVSLFTLGKPLL